MPNIKAYPHYGGQVGKSNWHAVAFKDRPVRPSQARSRSLLSERGWGHPRAPKRGESQATAVPTGSPRVRAPEMRTVVFLPKALRRRHSHLKNQSERVVPQASPTQGRMKPHAPKPLSVGCRLRKERFQPFGRDHRLAASLARRTGEGARRAGEGDGSGSERGIKGEGKSRCEGRCPSHAGAGVGCRRPGKVFRLPPRSSHFHIHTCPRVSLLRVLPSSFCFLPSNGRGAESGAARRS